MTTLFRVNAATTAITRLQFYCLVVFSCWCCLIASTVVVAVEGAWTKVPWDNPEGKVKNAKVSDCALMMMLDDGLVSFYACLIPFLFLFLLAKRRIYGQSMTSLLWAVDQLALS